MSSVAVTISLKVDRRLVLQHAPCLLWATALTLASSVDDDLGGLSLMWKVHTLCVVCVVCCVQPPPPHHSYQWKV